MHVKLSVCLLLALSLPGQAQQNPSPMVEHTRAHTRLKDESPEGRHEKLSTGTLFIPKTVKTEAPVPLLFFFHGAAWLPENAVAKQGKAAVIVINAGQGSAVYGKTFADPKTFPALVKEAEVKCGVRFDPIVLSGWSAGYGAVRAILRTPEGYDRVQAVLLLDGLHAGYEGGKPGPKESKLIAEDLDVFVKFAKDAAAGKRQFIVTHSEIFPGTFASTTETTDYLLNELSLKREAVLKWGPLGMQQLSEARKGKLFIAGFAGNSAPDHVDHLHALAEFLRRVEWEAEKNW